MSNAAVQKVGAADVLPSGYVLSGKRITESTGLPALVNIKAPYLNFRRFFAGQPARCR